MSLPNELLPVGLLGTGAAAAPASYDIERSLRFNSSDSAYLSRSISTSGNRKTWTLSCWVKRSGLSTYQNFFGGRSGNTGFTLFSFTADNKLQYLDGTNTSSGSNSLEWSYQFRDPSAWYHIQITQDTTQATAQDRLKLYVNGSRVNEYTIGIGTGFPAQNFDGYVNASGFLQAFSYNAGASQYGNFYLADVHLVDGQALTPSSFTETDATTGQLIPKAYTGTYGTNGFHLPFSDNSTAAALGTDTSGNGNDWTVNNITAGPATTSNSWSGYFDGIDDELSVPDNNAFTIGSNDFCMEAWVRPTGYPQTTGIIACQWGASGSSGVWQFKLDNSGNLVWSYDVDGSVPSGTVTLSTSGGIALNTWQHVAVTRSSTGTRLFVNGVLRLHNSATYSLPNPVEPLRIARQGYTPYLSGEIFKGYISNYRFINGSIPASYQTTSTTVGTSIFAVPTSDLTAVSGTTVLLLQSSSFVDNGPGGYTVTASGGARVSIESPFEESVDTDSLVDTPTNGSQTDTGVGGEVVGNYCTLNPLGTAGAIPTNGNLSVLSGTIVGNRISTFFLTSGKWYWEGVGYGYVGAIVGRGGEGWTGSISGTGSKAIGWWPVGPVYWDGGNNGGGTTYTSTDVIGVALDMDAGNVKFYKNGSLIYTITFGSGTVPNLSSGVFPAYNNGTGSSYSVDFNFGQRPFAYTAPSGYKALCTTNLPEGSITTSGTFTGNSSTDGPFVYLNGVPTAMTINGNAVTFGTHADKLSNGFKVRNSTSSYNASGSNTYSISSTGDKFKVSRAQANP